MVASILSQKTVAYEYTDLLVTTKFPLAVTKMVSLISSFSSLSPV